MRYGVCANRVRVYVRLLLHGGDYPACEKMNSMQGRNVASCLNVLQIFLCACM
jgi:hypothetical protein